MAFYRVTPIIRVPEGTVLEDADGLPVHLDGMTIDLRPDEQERVGSVARLGGVQVTPIEPGALQPESLFAEMATIGNALAELRGAGRVPAERAEALRFVMAGVRGLCETAEYAAALSGSARRVDSHAGELVVRDLLGLAHQLVAVARDWTPIEKMDEPCGCGPIPGVCWPINYSRLPGERRQVQRCDGCHVYESDVDAGAALFQHLAKTTGRGYTFTLEPDEPGVPDGPCTVYVDPIVEDDPDAPPADDDEPTTADRLGYSAFESDIAEAVL